MASVEASETDATLEGLARLLDRDAPEPLHDQISGVLRQHVVSGQWPPHMRLPSEPDLAVSLGVARGTVRRATRTLIEEGLLIQHQGRGTFVSSPTLEHSFEIISTADALDRQGKRYETTVITQRVTPAADTVAAQLHLTTADRNVVAIRRVRAVEGVPTFVLDNYVPAALAPGLESADVATRPLFTALEQDHGLIVSGVQRTFQAQVATEEIALLLKVSIGSPVFYLEQISYEQETHPIEYSDVWIRGDKLRLTAWLGR